jgi:AsmA protein
MKPNVKRLLIVLGAILVVVVALLALIPSLLDVNKYRDRIQVELKKQVGRDVQLGQMSLGLLPPTLKVQNMVIGDDPKYGSGTTFAQTAELDVRLKLIPLLQKDIQIESLRMVRPQVELIRGTDGTWNFSTMGAQNQPKPEQGAAPAKPIQLDRFEIADGSVAITDQQRHKPRQEYKNIDLLLKNYAPDKPLEVSVSAHLPGAGKQVVKFDGRGGPVTDATLVSTPFEATLQLDQVGLSGLLQYLNSKALEGMDASLGGSLKFKNDGGKVSANGTLRLENVVLHGKALGYPIELDYNASNDLKTELLSVSNTQIKVGSAPFVINGTVNSANTPAVADLKLNAEGASIADLVKLASALGAELSPGLQPSGKLNADLTAHGLLSGPAVAGTLVASQLKVSGVEANSLQIKLNMAPPGADVVKTLSGKVSVNLSEGRLTGVDLSQQLGTIGKLTGANKISNGATHITSLTGDFDLKNGLATTNDLKALTDAGTVAATGTASLVDEALNMKATVTLSKDSSKQMGGTAVGGLMKTTMSNKNGEIVFHLLVGGTIPSPKVTPDIGFGNVAQNLGKSGQAAVGALGGGASGVKNTLGGLFGGKKK